MAKTEKKDEKKTQAETPVAAALKKDPFKEVIQAHLNKLAEEDELFAVTLKKEKKNIDECIAYIFNQVKATGRQGFTDEEIFGMAVHYYDEDDIKPGVKPIGKVIVNHQVELTEEEKAKAKEKAIELATEELKEEVKKDLKVNVELSEEELSEAKQLALDKVISETKEKLTAKKQKKAATTTVAGKNETESGELSLF